MSGQPLKTILYVGLEVPTPRAGERFVHLPMIRIVPRAFSDPDIVDFYENLFCYTWGVFTSKQAVRCFFSHLPRFGYGLRHLASIRTAAVGKATAGELWRLGVEASVVAQEETAEGLCQALEGKIGTEDFVCWPRSALSRPVIGNFLDGCGCGYKACVFYDTEYVRPDPLPSLEEVDEIVFTSPSTVGAFAQAFKTIPPGVRLTAIGPVTEKRLFLLRDSRSFATMAEKEQITGG